MASSADYRSESITRWTLYSLPRPRHGLGALSAKETLFGTLLALGVYNGGPTMAGIVARKRFTADEYQRMGQAGILTEGDRVELIDGEIVAMTPIGTRHTASVNRGLRALVRAAGDDAIVQSQGS